MKRGGGGGGEGGGGGVTGKEYRTEAPINNMTKLTLIT